MKVGRSQRGNWRALELVRTCIVDRDAVLDSPWPLLASSILVISLYTFDPITGVDSDLWAMIVVLRVGRWG